MGNHCCSDSTQNRTYDPTLKKKKDFNPSASTITEIKFPPAKLPKRNEVVEQLNSQAGKFSAKNPMTIPSGTPSQPKLLNKNGLVYYGEWVNGIPHGKGQLYYPEGQYYLGYFNKGNADGEGRFISPKGWIYEGELENQQAQGKGVLYHKDQKYKYEGSWSGDFPNGYGREEWLGKNIIYEGEYLNGKKHGQGKYSTPQYIYTGHFNNDQFDSYGFISYKNGEKYEGNFEDGKKNGSGTYTWNDGSYYQGFYKNDVKHGQGKYKSDQAEWEGEWINGKREGQGILTVKNKRMVGNWSQDVFNNQVKGSNIKN